MILNKEIHVIKQLETYFVMSKNTAIFSVANTINKLHIQSDFHFICKKNFYYDKQDKIDNLFDEYHVPLLKNIGYPELIEEWKQNLDADAYEKN